MYLVFGVVIDPELVDPNLVTHINYAFVNVKDSMAWLTNLATDSINFRMLNGLKKQNPSLKILISIGGWSWSDQFSDAVLTSSSRSLFAQSAVDLIDQYDLDGIDVDWEYPGQKGEDNVFRPEDKEHYTLMFKEMRHRLDTLSQRTGKSYLLTTAVGANQAYIDHTDMEAATAYLDFVNLMTYDYYTVGPLAGHHANLHPTKTSRQSTMESIDRFRQAGVPAHKLVVGLPFYGRSWIVKSTQNQGIDQPIERVVRGGGYTYLKDSLQSNPRFTTYWDEAAQAPYLFDSTALQLVSYDDERSIRIKCQYVIDHELAGVMFWQYASDPKLYLLPTINEAFAPQ